MGFTKVDYLKAEGEDLVNQKGENIRLHGTNLGGWLMREGWMDGCGFCCQPVTYIERSQKDGVTVILLDNKRINRIKIKDISEVQSICLQQKDDEWINYNISEIKIQKAPDETSAALTEEIDVERKSLRISDNMFYFPEIKAKTIKIYGCKDLDEIGLYRFAEMDDYGARKVLNQRFGEKRSEELLRTYQNSYIQEDDILYLKKLGMNFLRVPIYWMELMDESANIKPNAWDQIDWIIQICDQNRIYVMLDLHGSPGGHSDGFLTGGQLDSNELWHNKKYQEMDIKIWQEIASRYKGNPTIAAYDLLNEPVKKMNFTNGKLDPPQESKDAIRKIYTELYHAVRNIDQDRLICMEAFTDFDVLGSPKERGWENVIYQTHNYYNDYKKDHDNQLKSMEEGLQILADHKRKWSVPILSGEFNFWEFTDIWERWLSLLNENGISWSTWAYKNIDNNKSNNWALFYNCKSEFVDYYRDEPEEIETKWKKFTTRHYEKNSVLTDVLHHFLYQDF